MSQEIDPVEELYSRYPYPPAEPAGKGWRRRFRKRLKEGRAIAEALLKLDPALAKGTLLDAGCGTGLKLLGLAEALPDAAILGVDFSQSSLVIARRIISEAGMGNITLAWANLSEGFPVKRNDSFDAVVCDGVLHHLKDPGTGLAHLVEALRPGGCGWITLFGKYGRAEMGRLRKMLNILEPRYLFFERRLFAVRALMTATGMASRKHGRHFREDAFLADAALNPRETWYDLVTARRFFEKAGLRLESWVDGEKYWRDLVNALKDAGLPSDEFEEPLSWMEKMRLVELWKCPGILRFIVRKSKRHFEALGMNAT